MVRIAELNSVSKFKVAVEKDGKDIGVGYLIVDFKRVGKPAGTIENVEVLETYRGHGYGREVVETLVQLARELGCYKVLLSCADHNIDFYKKLGFEIYQNNMRISL